MNKSIIGNNNQRRKPLDLTDRIMSEAKGYKKRKVKPQSTSNSSKPINNEIEPHEYNVVGDIQLNLKPIKDTYVEVSSQKEYDCLMQIYENGGWKMHNGGLPTHLNAYGKHGRGAMSASDAFYHSSNPNVLTISTDEFYSQQKITPKMIEDINEWFEDNHYGRESKGDQK